MSIFTTVIAATVASRITASAINARNAFIAEHQRRQAEMEALQAKVDETEEVKAAISTVRDLEGELLELRRKLRAAKEAYTNPYIEVCKEIKGYSPAYFRTMIDRKEREMKVAETTLLATRRAAATFIAELGEMPKAPEKKATYDDVKHRKSLKRQLNKIDSDIKALKEEGKKDAEVENKMEPNNGEQNTETAVNPSKKQDIETTAEVDTGSSSNIKAIEKEISDATQHHDTSSYTFTKLSNGAKRYLIFVQAQGSMRPHNQIGLIKSESGFIFIPMTESMLLNYKPENIENGIYKLRIPLSYSNADLLTELVIGDD